MTWTLLTEPNDGMGTIYSLMEHAQHSLDMTMYELADTDAEGILESDAARGVDVRVILDSAYSGRSANQAAYAALESHGVHVQWAPSGTIFHQKTITVDGATSAVMTLNLTSEYYATTRDFAVVTNDAADVAAIVQVFDSDWASGGPTDAGPGGTNLVWSPGATNALLSLIDSAHSSLLVENEEMDDPAVTSALEAAARRGVAVTVVMTADSEYDGALSALAAAGVKVGTYASDASLYIHAKVIVADGERAFIGSQNFSEASLEYNRELGLITSIPSLVSSVSATVRSDYAGSTPFTTPSTAAGAWCKVSASPANDGYSGDYDVSITSNQPEVEATASDGTGSYSHYTNSAGSAEFTLWHQSPGEEITVTVGSARCSVVA